MRSEWKPIEEFVEVDSGKQYLVFDRRMHQSPVVAWCVNGHWYCFEGAPSIPTHWMELPDDPK